jgi:hypothetical protein
MQKQLKRSGEDRTAQNADFQATVADQRATQKLLSQAVNVLKGFYQKKVLEMEKDVADTFVQINQEPASDMKDIYEESNLEGQLAVGAGIGKHEAPPAGFKTYENNSANTGVIAMITQIINDAKAMEAETIRDENEAQKTYEGFVKETNDNITSKNKEIVDAQAAKSTAEQDLSILLVCADKISEAIRNNKFKS